MSRILILCAIMTGTLGAQLQIRSSDDLLVIADKLQAALDSANWKQAAELSVVLKAAAEAARDQSLAKGSDVLVNQIPKWLPPDTETLAVSSVTVPLPISVPRGELAGAALMATSYILGLLESIQGGELAKKLAGNTVSLSVIAARHFENHDASPSGALPLGMIAYQGCGFYSLTSMVTETTFAALPVVTVAGRPTWTAQGKDYQPASDARPSDDSHFITLLKPNLLLVCNDRQFYETVVSRFSKPGAGRALPDTLPEWKHVNRAAPFWAIRHYIPDRMSQDPSMYTLGEFQAGSVGAIFQIGLPEDNLQLEIIGKPGVDPFKPLEGDQQFSGFTKKEITPGVWRLSADASEVVNSVFVLVAMGMLGFEVLL